MKFQHPEYFIGLLLIPMLIYLYSGLVSWKKKLSARIGDPSLVTQLVKSFSAKNFLLKFVLICVAVFFLVVGLANLRARGKAEDITRQGVDVMIVLDVSKSMLAQDVKPAGWTKPGSSCTDLLTDCKMTAWV
ncbi:MAG: BatA domain-containing protein [Puia sp.]